MYIYINSSGNYVAIRKDLPLQYGEKDGVGDQGNHFNAGVLNTSEIIQAINSGRNIKDVVKERLENKSDKLKQHHNYGGN